MSLDLTIARLAATAGVGVETIRYYQRRGLMTEPPRAGSIRRYGPGDIQRLQFIRQAQAAGFTLEEIGELLELDATDDRPRARAMAQARVRALDEQIAKLRRARDALKHLAVECAGGDKGPCPTLSPSPCSNVARGPPVFRRPPAVTRRYGAPCSSAW